jgi:hypothetical protein
VLFAVVVGAAQLHSALSIMWTRAVILICGTLTLGALTFAFLEHAGTLVLLWMAGALACGCYGAYLVQQCRAVGVTLIIFGLVQLLAMLIVPQFLKL